MDRSTSTSYIRPKNTFYKGFYFRSRAEANFAHFFDACHIDYEYELQTYDLPNLNSGYLPDFFLVKFDAWFEVKGKVKVEGLDIPKCKELARLSGKKVFLFEDHFKDSAYFSPEVKGVCYYPDGREVAVEFLETDQEVFITDESECNGVKLMIGSLIVNAWSSTRTKRYEYNEAPKVETHKKEEGMNIVVVKPDRFSADVSANRVFGKLLRLLLKYEESQIVEIARRYRESRANRFSTDKPYLYRREDDGRAAQAFVLLLRQRGYIIESDEDKLLEIYQEFRSNVLGKKYEEFLSFRRPPKGQDDVMNAVSIPSPPSVVADWELDKQRWAEEIRQEIKERYQEKLRQSARIAGLL